jgi:hypothetical protein
MGLIVRSLDDLPDTADREYFVYLLDYGWHEPLDQALKDNFDKIVTSVSSHKGVVIRRATEGIHFNDEVLSWHHINGEEVDKKNLLPAILITNRHPRIFKELADKNNPYFDSNDLSLILIPLKGFCKTTTDVVDALIKITKDIREKKDLRDFKIAKELKPGVGKAIVKGIVLEPKIAGMGFSFNKMIEALRKK